MALARLRAENARLRMERDILGKATAYLVNSIGCRNISTMEVLRRLVEYAQYCGHEFQSALAGYKMKSSMSRKGDCWDTQSKISLSVAFGLTRAGIGVMPLR